jgi:Protein of unknown function (DUF3054)
MSQIAKTTPSAILVAGDILTLALVTVFGFASHGEAGTAGLRMLTTFAPLIVAWFFVAPFFGVYETQRAAEYRQLWRPFWAMIVAGPMAAWLRSVMLGLTNQNGLNTPIWPVFVVVLGGVAALAVLAWRLIAAVFMTRMSRIHE